MSAGQKRSEDHLSVLREMLEKFEELAQLMGRALDDLGPDQAGSLDWHRLHRAKQAAEKGVALASSQLPRH